MKFKTFTTILVLLLFLTFQTDIFAQKNKMLNAKKQAQSETLAIEPPPQYFTYVTDKRFKVIHDLEGEIFNPAVYQTEQQLPLELSPGQMQIILGRQKVTIDGLQGLKELTITSKYPDRVGYIYELMDKDGKIARLKMVTNQDKYIDVIYFYSQEMGEHAFLMAEKTDEEVAADKSFYTPQDMYFVRSYRNLLDKEFKPYSMVEDASIDPTPTPIERSQNFSIKFEEEQISSPKGTFRLKKAQTFTYALEDFPSVRSMIDATVKGKPNHIYIFLNFKQQVEFIEIDNTRYFLMP